VKPILERERRNSERWQPYSPRRPPRRPTHIWPPTHPPGRMSRKSTRREIHLRRTRLRPETRCCRAESAGASRYGYHGSCITSRRLPCQAHASNAIAVPRFALPHALPPPRSSNCHPSTCPRVSRDASPSKVSASELLRERRTRLRPLEIRPECHEPNFCQGYRQ
jgi:hypothetical protein